MKFEELAPSPTVSNLLVLYQICSSPKSMPSSLRYNAFLTSQLTEVGDTTQL
jgi:hypothetical protein